MSKDADPRPEPGPTMKTFDRVKRTIGAADLMYALAEIQGDPATPLPAEQLQIIGECLGYARITEMPCTPAPSAAPSRTVTTSARHAADESFEKTIPFHPVPLLRQVEAMVLPDDAPEPVPPETQPLPRTPLNLPTVPRPRAPAQWSVSAMAPHLYDVVSMHPATGDIDVRRVLRDLTEGRALTEVPRLPRRRMVDRLRVVLDRSVALAPAWSDGDVIAEWLSKWGPSEVEVLRIPWGSSAWPAPEAGTTTVIVTDAGALASSGARQAWAAEGRLRQEAGEDAVLWMLGPTTPQTNAWPRVIRAPSAFSSRERRGLEVECLLTLASLAHQVEADLLRELRQILGFRDPTVELLAWRHPQLHHGSTATGQWTPDGFRTYRDALQSVATSDASWLTVDLLRTAMACIAKYRVLGGPTDGPSLVWWTSKRVWHTEIASWLTAAKAWDQTGHPHAQSLARCLRHYVDNEGWKESNQAYLKQLRAGAQTNASSQAVAPEQLRLWLTRLKLYEPASSWAQSDGCFYPIATALAETTPMQRLDMTFGASGLGLWPSGEHRTANSPVAALQGGVYATLEAFGHRRTLAVGEPDGVDLRKWVLGDPTEEGEDAFGRWMLVHIAGVPVRMRWIEPGSFLMGSPKTDEEAFSHEQPQHRVTLREGFWMAEAPCTQALWAAVMGDNPSEFNGDERPVENVSHEDVVRFLAVINDETAGPVFQLPTEAQWEYACRAQSDAPRYGELDAIAWYDENAGGQTHAARQKQPNTWGFYDMLGNVWEWCHDGMRGYDSSHAYDPIGPVHEGTNWVLRGGSWDIPAQGVRAAYRLVSASSTRRSDYGFRLSRGQGAPSQQAAPEGRGERPGPRGTRGQGADPVLQTRDGGRRRSRDSGSATVAHHRAYRSRGRGA